jgi:hypothetical protein
MGKRPVISDFTASGQRLAKVPRSRMEFSKASRPALTVPENHLVLQDQIAHHEIGIDFDRCLPARDSGEDENPVTIFVLILNFDFAVLDAGLSQKRLFIINEMARRRERLQLFFARKFRTI